MTIPPFMHDPHATYVAIEIFKDGKVEDKISDKEGVAKFWIEAFVERYGVSADIRVRPATRQDLEDAGLL